MGVDSSLLPCVVSMTLGLHNHLFVDAVAAVVPLVADFYSVVVVVVAVVLGAKFVVVAVVFWLLALGGVALLTVVFSASVRASAVTVCRPVGYCWYTLGR